MPATTVVFYKETDGSVPLIKWLDEVIDSRVRLKCLERLEQLEKYGHELRRPVADTLRDGIRELRLAYRGVQYRMLYFSHGKNFVVVTHGIQKEDDPVDPKEIDRAIQRRTIFQKNPDKHSFPKGDYDEEEGISVQGSPVRL